MFEILRTGWMNTLRNFWGERSIFPPWFLEKWFASDHPEGKGHSSCVCDHGIEKVGRYPTTLVTHKTEISCNPQSPVFAIVYSPNLCNLINDRFLEC